ncbi:MAG: hypothetical protein AB1391_01255 [Candidatus Micrarchaeota archaeon]
MVYYPTTWEAGPGCDVGLFCEWTSSWEPIIMLSMMTIFFMYAIIYMLSYFLQSEELKRSAKSHLLDAVFTAALAVSIILIMQQTFTFIQDYFRTTGASVYCDLYGKISLDNGASPFDLMKCRLIEKASAISVIYERVYAASREPFKKFSLIWGLAGLPIYSQGAYMFQSGISELYREIESYRLLAHVCVSLLIAINAYIGAIDYVSMNMLRMFLPMGIVLRAIPFTRNIGAFFISAAIGLYIIYPLLFVITDQTFVSTPGPYVDITDMSDTSLPWPSFNGAVSLLTIGPQSYTSSQIFSSMDIKQGSAELANLYYGLILQPIVILSITLIFIRYLTSLFGGEAQELFRLASKVV